MNKQETNEEPKEMKKRTVLLLAAMVFALSACGKENNIQDSTQVQPTEGILQEEETVPSEEATTAPEEETAPSEEETIAPEEPALQLPILDEIDQNVTVGTAGAYLKAVQSAVQLLDWGVATGLDPEEIKEAAVAWLSDKGNEEQLAFMEKMESVDDAYQKLLGDDAWDLLISAGCADAAYPWSDAPVESIEAIMEAVGLR